MALRCSRRGLGVAMALALCLAIPAQAELNQQGDLIVSFNGALSPHTLPRQDPAPVAITVAGTIKSATEGVPIPQLRTISVAINRAGRLYDKGLPTCRVKAIQPATEANAREQCSEAIVGSGHVSVQARIPTQVKAKLLAFNGPTVKGHKQILAQVYAKSPPGAFVLTFELKRRGGLFGTVMSTSLPTSAQGWAYLTRFQMTLQRSYRYRGKVHSYVSVACSAPAGFPGAVFPFAKASYGFANGQRLTTTVVRSCRVG